ncbi:hypothetical protein DV736_g2527, partial [Chaetothyriales sp. CBS 134916]
MPIFSDLKEPLNALFGSSAADNSASAPPPPMPDTSTLYTRPDNVNSDILLLPDGRKLGYAQCGSPTGRAVFFAHGHPGSRLDAAHLHEVGLKVGARIIAADRPGMGLSSPHPDRTLLDYPKDLEHLADHLKLDRYGVLELLELSKSHFDVDFSAIGDDDLITVISLNTATKLTQEFLLATIDEWKEIDDVFHPEFLHFTLLTISEEAQSTRLGDDTISPLEALGAEYIEVLQDPTCTLPTGFYIATEGYLFEAYRLYNDECGAFLTPILKGPAKYGFYQSTSGVETYGFSNYLPLTIFSGGPSHRLIAVRSRVFGSPARRGPLHGLRVAVKDNFHVNGLQTSLCNKAYLEIYPARTATAICIQELVDLGAHIVGTTKLAAFAATEEPLECTDFQAPWNPRADGYQSPAGSSSGSGVAIAAYDWLDIAIGSDTSGSGRRPAHWNGCFALRPSHEALDLEGLTLPWKLVVPREYLHAVTNSEQRDHINKFVSDLESVMNVRHMVISFAEAWDQHPPQEAGQQDLDTYMRTACRDSFFYDDYHNLDCFRDDYKRKFSKAPYVSLPVRFQWDLSCKIRREQRDEAVERLLVFRGWFAKHIMEIGEKNTIVVHPIENITPRYRDEARTHFVPEGIPMLFLSPIIGGPECVIPIAQVSYASRVTQRVELLPMGISMLAAPGTDIQLLDLTAACLKASGRPIKVLAGKAMFAKQEP